MSRNIKISKEITEARKRFNSIIKIIMESNNLIVENDSNETRDYQRRSRRLSEPVDCEQVDTEWLEGQGLYDTGTGSVQLGDEDAVEKVSNFFDVVVQRIRCLSQDEVATLFGGAWMASYRKNYIESLLDEWGVTNPQIRDILAAGGTFIEYHQWQIIASNWQTPHEQLNNYSGCQALSMALIRGAVYEVGIMTPGRINQLRSLATSKVGRFVLGIFGGERAMETIRLGVVGDVFQDEGELGDRVREADRKLTEYICGLDGIEDILNTTSDELLDIITLSNDEDISDPDETRPGPSRRPSEGPPDRSGQNIDDALDDEDEDEEDVGDAGSRRPPPGGPVRESQDISSKKSKLARQMIIAATRAGLV